MDSIHEGASPKRDPAKTSTLWPIFCPYRSFLLILVSTYLKTQKAVSELVWASQTLFLIVTVEMPNTGYQVDSKVIHTILRQTTRIIYLNKTICLSRQTVVNLIHNPAKLSYFSPAKLSWITFNHHLYCITIFQLSL